MDRADERLRERPVDHRRRTRRAERHATSEAIHCFDADDVDLAVPPRSVRDLEHKPPGPDSKRGRPGFKVWKTPFWKRRNAIRRQKAIAERQIAEE